MGSAGQVSGFFLLCKEQYRKATELDFPSSQ
jgi:hypothetical protein